MRDAPFNVVLFYLAALAVIGAVITAEFAAIGGALNDLPQIEIVEAAR